MLMTAALVEHDTMYNEEARSDSLIASSSFGF